VQSNETKAHVNIYGSNPRNPHDESIQININYEQNTFTVNENSDGEKTSTNGSCYLTTACMKYKMEEFDDNCEELTILRWFRDNFVTKEDIEHYYNVAPIIVREINESKNSNFVYNYIYENIVSVCVESIKNGDYQFAYHRYKSSILALEDIINKMK